MKDLQIRNINCYKEYIDKYGENFSADLSSMNVFDSLKFAVLSSAYFYQKFPESTLKCKVNSADLKNLVTSFKVQNLEFV